ncbi:aldolase/citrate lyase family protein [Pokkaliibacter sp. MBI-7]|uniref:HpcH/HpaI aldolase family protein n=1 Tax=Pokkaliibacter sp. MBI-7 TaxID=3040600 RepID=UPI002448BE66|nr:aldolase/citrate lyase family protein [Pokkaliibacter sp. MBI-7]MDH2433819.1 aldolase/citrate lyase family protein [Pokkaliibacter sp. MBI-7]
MSLNNTFKNKLLAGQRQLGGWSLSGSATIAEAMAHLDYDYLVLDLEHGPSSTQDLLQLLRAVEQTTTQPVVRMASHDPIAIKQALDLGAMNLYFPFVENVAEAEAIVQAAFYPPAGRRGFAKMHRASRYGTRTTYVEDANDAICLMAQLETPEALAQAVEIGKVPGISAVFIGPGDLSAALGLHGQVNHPEVRQLAADTVARCREAGIAVGTVVPAPADAVWAFGVGFSYVSIANDVASLLTKCREHLADARQGLGEAL